MILGKLLNSLRAMNLLSKSRKAWWKDTYEGTVLRLPQGEVVCDDALHFLNCLTDECADIVFLDPPFNLGKSYGSSSKKDDLLNESQYLKYMTSVLWRCAAILKEGGALYLYHIPRWAVRLSTVLGHDIQFRHCTLGVLWGCTLGKASAVTVKVSGELKEKMKRVKVNWSEYIRDAIQRKVEEQRVKAASAKIDEVRKRAKSVSTDELVSWIREDREKER